VARIGIEWVVNYAPASVNLPATRPQAERFWNTLSGEKAFNFGDNQAWDIDFEQQGTGFPSSGADRFVVELADITYFAGHGSVSGPLFSEPRRDDTLARPSEMRLGDGLANWVVFDACEVLLDPGVERRFSQVFNGLHYVLGFHTICSDEKARGGIFADYLNQGDRMRDAWRKACQETEPFWLVWAYIRASTQAAETFVDHWHGQGEVSADPVGGVELTYFRQAC